MALIIKETCRKRHVERTALKKLFKKKKKKSETKTCWEALILIKLRTCQLQQVNNGKKFMRNPFEI